MVGLILLGSAFLCLLGWLILYLSQKRPQKLLQGEVVYCGIGKRDARVLKNLRFGLSGIPDYIIRQGDEFIPVEIKSGKTPKKLYESDRMQVVAQALLVEAEFGRLPTRGFVWYPDRIFIVKIEPKYIKKLVEAIRIMSKARETGIIPNLYPSWYYCPTCPRINCPKRKRRPTLIKSSK